MEDRWLGLALLLLALTCGLARGCVPVVNPQREALKVRQILADLVEKMNEDWIAYFVDDIQRHYEDRYGILFVRFAHAVNETRRLANLYLQQAVEEEYMN